MCRNIKPLFNYDPPATEHEVHDAATQFVRKLSGMQKPSSGNQIAFDNAIHGVEHVITDLLATLATSAQPRSREVDAQRAKERAAKRFA